jgi:hypothetical protein
MISTHSIAQVRGSPARPRKNRSRRIPPTRRRFPSNGRAAIAPTKPSVPRTPAPQLAQPAASKPGTTPTTVEALRRRDVPVAGVVLNEYASETTAERTNPDALQEMTGLPVETIPPLPLDDPRDAVAGVREHLPDSLVPAE